MSVEKTAIPAPHFVRRADSGAVIIKRWCQGCGSPMPAFGVGVRLLKAFQAAERKQPYQQFLGTWWCAGPGQCRNQAQGQLL